ncbi:MAG: enoyl-CoA hydratase/isomerase family protein, partial [Hyphomicrobiales bacterium]
MAEADILFETRGSVGLITLNRPKALNAVTYAMVCEMPEQLARWARDDAVACVVVRAVPGRAFSAGGDIRELYAWRQAGDRRLVDFYDIEYRLNRTIKHFPKPYIALIDGIVMGGGVGISIHGSHRLVTKNALFAMPETGIGFFPDVGGTYFLPRCPGRLGHYIGLTGARLGAADMAYAGLATMAVGDDAEADILSALAAGDPCDKALEEFSQPVGEAPLAALRADIDHCFAGGTVDAILERLEADCTPANRQWGIDTAASIRAKAPLATRVALRQLNAGAALDFDACMALEYRLVNRFMGGSDFFEGVRAAVIDKDRSPRWNPATLAQVSDAMVDDYFAPLEHELTF